MASMWDNLLEALKNPQSTDEEIEKLFDKVIKEQAKTPDALAAVVNYTLSHISIHRPPLAKKISAAIADGSKSFEVNSI